MLPLERLLRRANRELRPLVETSGGNGYHASSSLVSVGVAGGTLRVLDSGGGTTTATTADGKSRLAGWNARFRPRRLCSRLQGRKLVDLKNVVIATVIAIATAARKCFVVSRLLPFVGEVTHVVLLIGNFWRRERRPQQNMRHGTQRDKTAARDQGLRWMSSGRVWERNYTGNKRCLERPRRPGMTTPMATPMSTPVPAVPQTIRPGWPTPSCILPKMTFSQACLALTNGDDLHRREIRVLTQR